MNRRTILKNLALVIGGSVLLPSCLHSDGTSYVQLKHVQINEDQQKLMADVAETIIPKTNTPGAKELGLPAFTLKMIDDCFNKKEQEAFVAGLVAFQNKIKKEHGKDFGWLDVKQREAILLAIEKAAQNAKPGAHPDPVTNFFSIIKGQTTFGYTTSQYFMTKEIPYELVPGRYIVHHPVSKLKLKTA
ncbi:gluconate 2-dehydrogenase subunit 3 family protein [Mucilaginibacter sp. L3T2-6]|uniref:gluconate 2-dehydrogenase subunit 3 family protein n=1 Tax=Mucilaginibacter sp. L3T2-6 TaxID=3062491 RepID=UPI002676B0F5|nr:gluconate 2-dehydrogenase subunit 3 family protein [Mucilaginibacter sp. L3T2-6]MDO3644134.1 gluconate 2-dehydrogenase subunit 3 family protein [Mucilaginibacter sp. L3T2-6]MDV6216585.1 gluconate 2-dehydrogenase subunit 3 family protein [Mucilaginibacter sp. L3T2-6]